MSTSDHVRVPTTTQPIAVRRASAQQRRTLLGIGLGNALETFDWSAYALFAPFFATQIFNPADPGAALLATFAVFGAGFLIRPFGAVAFGWLADRKGRKVSLIAAILCASAGLLLIGAAPTYQSAGLLGAAILLVARLLQGVAHTGEVAAAYTYIAEVAPPARRGLWSSVIYSSGLGATLLASLFGTLLTAILDHQQMTSWGWRIPFLAGAALGLFTLVLRRRMNEPEAFVKQIRDSAGEPKRSVLADVWRCRGAGARVFLLTAANAVFFYAWIVAGPSWAVTVAKLAPAEALLASCFALGAGVAVLPILGALSDRIGRRRSTYIYGIGVATLAYPLDQLGRGGAAWRFALAMTIAVVLFAFLGSMFPALLAELFPTGIRASGIALPYALAAVFFAGTAPFLQQWLNQRGSGVVFVAYIAVTALLGAVAMYFSPETRGIDLSPTGDPHP